MPSITPACGHWYCCTRNARDNDPSSSADHLGGRHGGRKVELDRHGGHRRGHHEDDQQHEHDVDERRDVDFGILFDVIARTAAATELSAHDVTP